LNFLLELFFVSRQRKADVALLNKTTIWAKAPVVCSASFSAKADSKLTLVLISDVKLIVYSSDSYYLGLTTRNGITIYTKQPDYLSCWGFQEWELRW
jgi:hypothetical protein